MKARLSGEPKVLPSNHSATLQVYKLKSELEACYGPDADSDSMSTIRSVSPELEEIAVAGKTAMHRSRSRTAGKHRRSASDPRQRRQPKRQKRAK